MTWTEKDIYRLKISINAIKSLIEQDIEKQRRLSEHIKMLRLELACLEHCHEEIL